MSFVKQSARKGRDLSLSYTFQEADLDKEPERFEIELEVENYKVGIGTDIHRNGIGCPQTGYQACSFRSSRH